MAHHVYEGAACLQIADTHLPESQAAPAPGGPPCWLWPTFAAVKKPVRGAGLLLVARL